MNAYEILADQVLQKIRSGIVPWRQPWKGWNPSNFVSGKEYRGFNRLVLSFSEHEDLRYLTAKQIFSLGGAINKGAKGSKIFFFKLEDIEWEKESYPILRYYYVYNIADTTGIPYSVSDQKETGPSMLAKAQGIVTNYQGKPRVEHGGQAYYSLIQDRIMMPSLYKFKSDSAYFSTLFHECIHSTGHKDRLWRLAGQRITLYGNKASYSREELVAEIGAMFLCQEAGISTETSEESHAYLAGWLKYLEHHKKELIHAAAEAQKASDYILGNIVPSES